MQPKTPAEIIRCAEEDAAELLKNAQDKAADLIAQSVVEKSRLSSEIAGLQRAIEAARAEIGMLQGAKEVAEEQFSEAKEKLDALLAQVKVFAE